MHVHAIDNALQPTDMSRQATHPVAVSDKLDNCRIGKLWQVRQR